MVVGESKRANIMDGIENTGDVRLHDHRLRLKQRFDIVRKLGQGTYGKVQLGINKKTGQEVAIKTIKKCKIESEADLIRIRREVQIMSSVRHPNIVHIYEVFENSEKMILVMEYCSGGELYDYLSQKKVLQEDEARRLFRQIATAVYYCHIHKICHRDLKLENVLLDDTGSAKIADFGLSNVFKETSLLSTFCGSPLYASPEIVKGTPYIGPEVDCWSLGVLLYTLVYGAMPFDGSNFKRLVRQISNGDYYEPKNPSTASPLIRDMLTVDPLKRADIAYICDHSWVNEGCGLSCLEMAQALAAETPVRLDLLLSLAPAAPSHCNSVLLPPQQAEMGTEESGADLTSSSSMAVEPSNSAEKRILELVAEGGEDAIKPSPTRTIVSAGDNKRKLELAMSASGLQRKKERVASSSASIAAPPAVPEETAPATPPEDTVAEPTSPPTLKSSATITIQPSPAPALELVKDATREVTEVKEAKEAPKESPKEEPQDKTGAKPRVTVKKKATPKPTEEKASPDKQEEAKQEEPKKEQSSVAAAADKLTSLSLAGAGAAAPAPKPKKPWSGNVGSFKEQFERRASLTATPDLKRNVTKPVVSKIAKPKAQSEDRELSKTPDNNGTVRLQQIGIEPSPTAATSAGAGAGAGAEEATAGGRGGVKKTESEPAHSSALDPAVLLQDARRSLQNSMAKLAEEKAGEDRRRAARDIISTAIRTGKPPVPYGRSSSAGVATLLSPPGTPPAAPATAPAAPAAPRVFRTEAQHRVDDHRNRGVSVERIIPINLSPEDTPTSPPPKPSAAPAPVRTVQPPPLRRLVSSESTASEASSPSGEPIKKSAREFIIPIAVEGKGYVTPRQRSLEPEAAAAAAAPAGPASRLARNAKPRRISSLVSGGESEEEDDSHMHRLRSTRAARAESVSSGEEDEEDEGFHLLTAENLFSTLLHRVRALTNRLNGEEGPGFPQHPHSLFNNLHQSPFFNSPHLPRRNLLREGWGSRDFHTDLESMFSSPRAAMPRGNSKKSKHTQEETAEGNGLDLSDLDLSSIELSERELRALSGLTPALSRRLQRQLLASLPPAAARTLRRTLSQRAAAEPTAPAPAAAPAPATAPADYCTLPRLRRGEAGSARSTPERPLLSKYLTPERALSLDEPAASDAGSITSEPPYGAAPLRRHSLRLAADGPRKRISRFLRSDFFDAPPDESAYLRHKQEKELETQKILREIREKKNRSLESPASGRSPTEAEEGAYTPRKCLSPLAGAGVGAGAPAGKERSRSTTPFFPILGNIKENALDTSLGMDAAAARFRKSDEIKQKYETEDALEKDTKLIRPKSYPVKNRDSFDEPPDRAATSEPPARVTDAKDKTLPRESKLIRPKSYPTSSPSPEKVFINRNIKTEETKTSKPKEDVAPTDENKNDVEVSFSITLPKKSSKPIGSIKTDTLRKSKSLDKEDAKIEQPQNLTESSLILKKYQVVSSVDDKCDQVKDHKAENGSAVTNGIAGEAAQTSTEEIKLKATSNTAKSEEVKLKTSEAESTEKKGTIKKKIIKKVSSKTKTEANDQGGTDIKAPVEKKKVTKKVKEKSAEDVGKTATVTKKKSMLQSIGHKLEKLASNKSSSPEKAAESSAASGDAKKEGGKVNRSEREHSVPARGAGGAGGGAGGEAGVIQRAATLADVAALDAATVAHATLGKTTVSKVLGLFKKFEPKEKTVKPPVEKSPSDNLDAPLQPNGKTEPATDVDSSDVDRPRRPTSLLLNGLGRKTKYGRAAGDGVSGGGDPDDDATRKETGSKNIRNSLKLDFSRLPRVKKIVPTNPVIEPQIMSVYSDDKYSEKKEIERNGTVEESGRAAHSPSRSRSRSRSTFSNSEVKSDNSAEVKYSERSPLSLLTDGAPHPVRNHEPTTPEKEDIVERIRRKSFYSRFNEKKQRRKSNLVGPGAAEYDPLARIHAAPAAERPDLSPASPAYDLSPGYSVASDLSPSTDRYRSLLADLPSTARTSLRYDSYGLGDKIDTYRSLDRAELRKYGAGARAGYADYEPPSYAAHRYSRTRSLLDSCEPPDEVALTARDPLKYHRTISMYSPGSYATYRPRRTTLNPAIILKESEKEPSPENILEKIRNRKKISISVTRKPDPEKELPRRSDIASQGEGDGTERAAQAD